MHIPPNEYLDKLSNGDKVVIKDIYVNTFPKVVRFVKNNQGNQADAEDIFQKALLQIIARYKVNQFELRSSFESYFYTACKNLWRRKLNKQKREVTNEGTIELVSEAYDMSMAIIEQQKWDLFQEKIDLLSDNCKLILALFFKGIPYNEITSQLKYSSENVLRQRIFKCKKKLTDLIKTDNRYQSLK